MATTTSASIGTIPTGTTSFTNKISASGNSWLDGGNVGIGTVTPYSALTVSGLPPQTSTSTLVLLGSNFITGGNVSGTLLGANPTSTFTSDFINFEVSSTSEFDVSATGTVIAAGKVYATGGFNGQCLTTGVFDTSGGNSCNMDVAESYPTFELTAPGDVVAVPPSNVQAFDASSTIVKIGKSRGAAGERVIGVVSTNPGLVFKNGSTFLAGANDRYVSSTETVVALTGRVPVSVSLENGPIAAGDELSASADLPGVAVRAIAPGNIIGVALQPYNATTSNSSLIFQPSSTVPQILVFVGPHWSLGNLTAEGDIAYSSWAASSTSLSSGGSSASQATGGILDQLTLYIKYALQKLGLAIANGIATVQQLFANKITTNELCVGTTCVNQQQLAQLLANTNSGSAGNNIPSGAGNGNGDSNAPTPPANITIGNALGIAFVSPVTGNTVSGTVELDVNITLAPSSTISRLDYELDGADLGQGLWTNNPAYSYSWNTAASADASHTLTALVTDSTGATSTAKLAVTVDNGAVSGGTDATSTDASSSLSVSDGLSTSTATTTDVSSTSISPSASSSDVDSGQ